MASRPRQQHRVRCELALARDPRWELRLLSDAAVEARGVGVRPSKRIAMSA
jgi:hypothetical protein